MPDIDEDTAFAGVAGQAALLAGGHVTATTLTRAALARIAGTRSTLNAFRRVCAERALRDAAEADRRLARGERAPLLGVPVAVKDDTDIAGLPTSLGCAGEFPPAAADAEVVRRLKDAGAVLVGKTNMPELGQWPFTEGSAFGITRNPWHAGYSPGGSSGGSAVAVAAGLVAGALGSDGAGSLRIPAAWTNLVGIKTQRGLVPSDPEPEVFHGLTVHGPLARTVADAALLLDVVAGTGDAFRTAARTPAPPLRVGLALRAPFSAVRARLDPRVRDAVLRLAGVLRGLGHEVVPAAPRYGLIGLGFLPRSVAGVADWVERVPDPALLCARSHANRRAGRRLRPALGLARRSEAHWQRRVGAVFDEVDVLLAPTTATPPLPAGLFGAGPSSRTDRAVVAACPYAWPWNLLGWPAANVPAGLTAEGLPLGAQLLGPPDSEELLISVAAHLETAERWQDRRP